MRVRMFMLAAAAALAAALPARAALVLEFIQVASINAAQSAAPALPNLVIPSGGTVFLQVALRDTVGSGPDAGQGGTVAWQTNGGNGGNGAVILGAFFIRFDSDAGTAPGAAVNPTPTSSANARLTNTAGAYSSVNAGTQPPTFTRFGGLINGGFEADSTTVPDPVTHRIALFNLKIVDNTSGAGGSGLFHLKDPNPTPSSADSAILMDANPGAGDGTLVPIDSMLFGANFLGTFDLPYSVVAAPEPTSLAFGGLALAGFAARKLRRRKVA